jgi:hypothetical protein
VKHHLAFRLAVASSLLTSIAAMGYSVWAESRFPQEWRDVLSWNGNGGILPYSFDDMSVGQWMALVFICLLVFVILVNDVLFFFYWRYSRAIYLWTSVLGITVTLMCGLLIMTPIEGALYHASLFLSGIALALAYCSPVAERFTSSPTIERGATGLETTSHGQPPPAG